MAKNTRWMLADEYFQNEPQIKSTDSVFGTETIKVDNYGGYVCAKEGTGLEQNQDLLDRVQDNIRERFGLQTPEDQEDTSDYNQSKY